jgi:hypothetical protein
MDEVKIATDRLIQILVDAKVHSTEDYHGLTILQREKLGRSVYAWFAAFQADHCRLLKGLEGFNYCLQLEQHRSQSAAVAVKKLVCMSNTAVVLTPQFHHPSLSGPPVPTVFYQIIFDNWALVSRGLLLVIPKRSHPIRIPEGRCGFTCRT